MFPPALKISSTDESAERSLCFLTLGKANTKKSVLLFPKHKCNDILLLDEEEISRSFQSYKKLSNKSTLKIIIINSHIWVTHAMSLFGRTKYLLIEWFLFFILFWVFLQNFLRMSALCSRNWERRKHFLGCQWSIQSAGLPHGMQGL